MFTEGSITSLLLGIEYYKLTFSSFSLYDSEKLSPPILRLLMN